MPLPLTKHKKSGEVYKRRQNIELEIDAALGQDLSTIIRRAPISDSTSSNFLTSECIVHLIRDARRRDDHPKMNGLLPVLLWRCERILIAKIPDSYANATGLRDEVLSQFSELFAVDNSTEDVHELDFFECRFNAAFRAFRIDLMRMERTRTKVLVQLPDTSDEPASDDAGFARLSKALCTPSTQEGIACDLELREAIYALPPDECEAVVLCCILGFDVESENPAKQTAAKQCGVTGRTIRNRLQSAVAKLSHFWEDA